MEVASTLLGSELPKISNTRSPLSEKNSSRKPGEQGSLHTPRYRRGDLGSEVARIRSVIALRLAPRRGSSEQDACTNGEGLSY